MIFSTRELELAMFLIDQYGMTENPDYSYHVGKIKYFGIEGSAANFRKGIARYSEEMKPIFAKRQRFKKEHL